MERINEIETRLAEIATLVETDGADLDALEAEVRILKDERKAIEAQIEQRAAIIKDVKDTGKTVEKFEEIEERDTMDNKEIRSSQEYLDAYVEYLKSGDAAECRKLMTENVTGGTVAVPTYVEDRIKTAWERNRIMDLVTKTYYKGNDKAGFEISGSDAVIHTEGTSAPAEETLTFGTVTLTAESVKKWITITDEVLDTRGEAFIDYVVDELTYKIAKKTADILIGKIATLGTASTADAVGAAQVTAAPTLGAIAQAMAALSDEADNPVVVINKGTWGAFKAAQAAGNYAYDPFEGLEVVYNNSLPTYASASSSDVWAIVGDFGEGARANFPNGGDIVIKVDDLSLAEYDLVKLVGRQYVAVEPVAPFAFTNIIK